MAAFEVITEVLAAVFVLSGVVCSFFVAHFSATLKPPEKFLIWLLPVRLGTLRT